MPAEAILQETHRTQLVGLVGGGAASLLDAAGKERVLLVSDPAHSLRIEDMAEELGLTAVHLADPDVRHRRLRSSWPRRRPAWPRPASSAGTGWSSSSASGERVRATERPG